MTAVKHSWGAHTTGYCVLVHGGAGNRGDGERPHARAGCAKAAQAAATVLRGGGSALDAVQRAVEVLEDDPLFNAGTGGALTSEGDLELDAAIMDGSDLRAGGVCCLPPFRHPVAVARAVLEEGRHVLYAGEGAEAFARRAGFAPAELSAMITSGAREQLARALEKPGPDPGSRGNTVGAVARDLRGRLAAATSTGGISGKRPGRVGDSPIPGAGNYADDTRGAASATGLGEGILRLTLSARAVADMATGQNPQAAACEAVAALIERVGAHAGIILVAPNGRLGLARTTQSMSWAAAWENTLEAGD